MARLHRRASSGAYGLPAPALNLDFLNAFDSAMSRLTFTRASSASYFDATGAMQIASTNVPRFDTNPVTLAPLGLAIEEARTNLLLNSAAPATQDCTVAATAYTLSFYGTGTITLSGVSSAGPLVGTGAYPVRSTLTFTPTAGTLTLTVTGTVEYANLEAGSFATSWIETAGTTATRAADVCSALTSSFAFNPAAGTMRSRVVFKAPAASGGNAVIAQLSDATVANTVQFRREASAGTLTCRIASGGVTANPAASAEPMVVDIDSCAVIAYGIGTDAAISCLDGDLTTASSPAAAPVGMTRLSVGTSNSLASAFLNGWIFSLDYYPTRLSNAQLQAITA